MVDFKYIIYLSIGIIVANIIVIYFVHTKECHNKVLLYVIYSFISSPATNVIMGWSMIMTVKLLMLCIKHGYFGCMGQPSRSGVFHKAYILLVPCNTKQIFTFVGVNT